MHMTLNPAARRVFSFPHLPSKGPRYGGGCMKKLVFLLALLFSLATASPLKEAQVFEGPANP